MPLWFREAVMAHHFGYASVRERPLDGRDFNLWWIALDRFNKMQSEEGRKEIVTGVGVQAAMAIDASALSGEYGTAAMRVTPPKIIGDPVTQRIPWTDPGRMLALLQDDDPRAIYLRSGGRLDASGDPILPASTSSPQPPKWRGN